MLKEGIMAARLPSNVQELSEFTESKNIMVYGDTGSGKSGLIAQLPGKVLILSAEVGTVVIKRMAIKFGWDVKDIMKRFKVWPIRALSDMEEAYEWIKANPDAFDWVAVDSATRVEERAMRAAMEVAVKRNPEKRDIDLPDRGEHQKMQNAIKRLVVDFNDLPVNMFWVAQAMNREDKDGNDIVLPFILGKDYEVSAFICAQMHAYFYMKKRPLKVAGASKGKAGATERILVTDSYADSDGVYFWAKDRYMVFPKVVVISRDDEQINTLTEILAKIDEVPNAVGRAKAAIETYDDKSEDLDDDPDDDDTDDDEPDEDETTTEERRAELNVLNRTNLRAAAKAAGLKPADLTGLDADGVIDEILKAEGFDLEPEDDDEPDEDVEPDDDEPDDDDDDDSDDDSDDDDDDGVDEERRAELMEMGKAALREAVEGAGLNLLDLRGKTKEEVVAAVLEAESDDDDDEPDDEPEPEPEPAPKTGRAKKATGRFRPADEEE